MECNSEIRGNISIQNSKYIGKLENDGGRIAINPDKFDKLITALRTAVDNDGTLDKEATSYNRLEYYEDILQRKLVAVAVV
jgi:hypothetical protein